MKSEQNKETVKKEINMRRVEKPKPAHSRKAPLIAGLVAAAAFAVGACTAKDGKPVENKKGDCIYEGPVVETKTVSYAKTVKEGDIACQGTKSPIASPLKVVKIGEREIELAYEADIAMGKNERTINIIYGTGVKLISSDLAPTIKVEKGENTGEAIITVEYSELYSEWLKDNDLVENYNTKTISYTKPITREGDSFPLAAWTGSDSRTANADLRVIDIDEKGIEVYMGSYGTFVGKPPLERIKIPYEETLRLEVENAIFEITPEKKCVDLHVVEGRTMGTVVTVKTTILCKSDYV